MSYVTARAWLFRGMQQSPTEVSMTGNLMKRLKTTSSVSASCIETHKSSLPAQKLSIAPMMDYTDVHYRQLARLMSKNTWLYTEMVVDKTLIFNPNHDKFLWFPPEQHPISCQLGGSDPESLAQAAKVVASYGYDEINLNCGCPSDKVAGAGCFGAAMMLQPENVAACCSAMAEAAPSIPITVKCRIGVDDVDSYDSLHNFIRIVSTKSPVTHFIIHARKCLLKGLSPHQNRTVPPLRYEWLLALKRDFPDLQFSLNGGILTLEETRAALDYPCAHGTDGIHGVMIGRAAYNSPWKVLSGADVAIWNEDSNPGKSRKEVLYKYAEYADAMVGRWHVKKDGHKVPSVRVLVKPVIGMFAGEKNGKKWRAGVDQALRTATSVTEVLDATLPILPDEVLDAPPYTVVRGATTPTVADTILPSLGKELPKLEPVAQES